MRGDEALPADGDGPRTRLAPRHAAPRKSLFTKLQMPAGKAIAIAAMPTAVLMGMGITPHLALADEMPKNPYAPGPCVTQSDTPPPDATTTKPSTKPSASESAAPSTKPASSPSPSASTAEPKTAAKALPKAAPTTAAKAAPKSAPTAAAPSTAPKATPSPTKSFNPWDPLGVGDAIKDVLGLNKTATPTTAPTTAPTTKAPTTAPTTAPAKAPSTSSARTPAASSSSPPALAGKSARTGTAGEDATDKPTPEKSATATPSATPSATDGKTPFPCPTHDAKALADAPYETEHGLLPDQPWYLESSALTLYGLDYKGIVTVKTTNGTLKKVLKFTASSLDIQDLHQLVNGVGYVHHVQGKGTKSTIKDGTVTMYTEELKGNLFGIIPVTFSPDTPPPINVPLAVFTNVKIRQAGQFGGTLHISNLHQSTTKGSYP